MIHAQVPVRTLAPSGDVVPLEAVKSHLRVDHDADDELIAGLITSAVSHLDGWSGILGRCLLTQRWRVALSGFPSDGRILLPLRPVTAASISYTTAAGDSANLDASAFNLVQASDGAAIERAALTAWPTTADRPDAVRVEITCGYGAGGDVPPAIRQAILLMAGHWYEHREAVITGTIATELPLAVRALLDPLRAVRV